MRFIHLWSKYYNLSFTFYLICTYIYLDLEVRNQCIHVVLLILSLRYFFNLNDTCRKLHYGLENWLLF